MRKALTSAILLASILLVGSCLPSTPTDHPGAITITVYGFSIMKEVMEKEIYTGFAAKWKREHGADVGFVSSFAGSETVTNQILQGAPADFAVLAIERDAQRLFDAKATTTDWRTYPNKGIINKTPFVILVRKGNPLGITDFPDLAKPGVRVIHPDPVSSGGAQWSVLAIYGSELMRAEAQGGGPEQAVELLRSIWKNVFATPGSAREARTHFETGFGDALVTYELEGLLMKAAGADIDMVVPSTTIYSEHPAVVIDKNMEPAKRQVVNAFLQYMWSDEAQQAFVKYHLRSATNDALNRANPQFAVIEHPFTIDMFGGWDRAYPEIIEKVFKDQVQNFR